MRKTAAKPAPPLISGASFLVANKPLAKQSFNHAHETLTTAEAEIKRLVAIIESIPDADREMHRLMRLVSEHVMHGGTHGLTDEEVDRMRQWYFRERCASV